MVAGAAVLLHVLLRLTSLLVSRLVWQEELDAMRVGGDPGVEERLRASKRRVGALEVQMAEAMRRVHQVCAAHGAAPS